MLFLVIYVHTHLQTTHKHCQYPVYDEYGCNFFSDQLLISDSKIENSNFYRPQRSCEGYVFTPVCHSFCSQWPPKRAVRILLECILVYKSIWSMKFLSCSHTMGSIYRIHRNTSDKKVSCTSIYNFHVIDYSQHM